MRARSLAGLVAILFLLAGCVGTGGSDKNASDGDPATPGGGAPGQNGTLAPPHRTLERPPGWLLGEWWHVRVTDGFTGLSRDAVRVVAGEEGDNYLVGMPRDAFNHEIMVLHVPGFGQVDKYDLAFDIHDVPFIPVQFPLTDNTTWDTAFEGRPLSATVELLSPTEAAITFTRTNNNGQVVERIDAVYSAELGEMRSMEITNNGNLYARVEVLDHGFGYEGVVTVPHEHTIVFMNGRAAGVVSAGMSQGPVAAPVETLTVPSDLQRISFILVLADMVLADQPGQGVYEITAVAPDGQEFSLSRLPGAEPGWAMSFYGKDDPGGDWELRYVAAGPGFAFIEGIAYHVYDVLLPEGCLMPMEGEHAHGDHACGDGDPHAGH